MRRGPLTISSLIPFIEFVQFRRSYHIKLLQRAKCVKPREIKETFDFNIGVTSWHRPDPNPIREFDWAVQTGIWCVKNWESIKSQSDWTYENWTWQLLDGRLRRKPGLRAIYTVVGERKRERKEGLNLQNKAFNHANHICFAALNWDTVKRALIELHLQSDIRW